MAAGRTGLRRFERCVIVVGDAAVIVLHGGDAAMVMVVMVLVVVVVSVHHQLVTVHMEMVAARVRVEDKPGAWHSDTRDKE